MFTCRMSETAYTSTQIVAQEPRHHGTGLLADLLSSAPRRPHHCAHHSAWTWDKQLYPDVK